MITALPGALQPNALFELQFIRSASLSPDGRHIAYCVSTTDEDADLETFEIRIHDVETRSERLLSFDGNATWPAWSPDGQTLAFVAANSANGTIGLHNLALKETLFLDLPNGAPQGPIDWSPSGERLAFTAVEQTLNCQSRRVTTHLFRADGIGFIDGMRQHIIIADLAERPAQPAVRKLPTDCQMAMKPVFSPCGERLLFQATNEAIPFASYSPDLFCADLRNNSIHKILGEDWFISEATWTSDGERIVIAGAFNSPLTVPVIDLWAMDADGRNAECRTRERIGNVGYRVHHDMPNWDATQFVHLAMTTDGEACATVQKGGCAEIWSIALSGEIKTSIVHDGDRSCILLDSSLQADRLLFLATDLRTPGDLYVSGLHGYNEQRLTFLNDEALEQWPTFKVRHLNFQAPDGLPLEGWIMSREDLRGPLPAILYIHGGPYSSTGQGFRFDLQLLASHGYAVVFSNFRGSAGYGKAFVEAMRGDWGANGFGDHMATVDAAIAAGCADEERLAVWGASHGGFATAWMVGHTDRFNAAVAEASVTNFATAYYLSDAPGSILKEMGARPDQEPELYRMRSPITYAQNCVTPTLMLHGEQDLRAPLAEAEQFYRALADNGCTVEMEIIPGANHLGDSVGPLSARRRQNEALVDWFQRFI